MLGLLFCIASLLVWPWPAFLHIEIVYISRHCISPQNRDLFYFMFSIHKDDSEEILNNNNLDSYFVLFCVNLRVAIETSLTT